MSYHKFLWHEQSIFRHLHLLLLFLCPPMHTLTELAYVHLHSELYNSSLLLGEFLLNHRIDLPYSYYILAKSLSSLGYHGKLQEFLDDYPDILQYRDIYLIYLRRGTSVPDLKDLYGSVSQSCISVPAPSDSLQVPRDITATFCIDALQLLFTALNKGEKLRKKLLIASFKKDPFLLEPLLLLLNESLCTLQEALDLTSSIEAGPAHKFARTRLKDYKIFIKSLLSPNSPGVVMSPFRVYLQSIVYSRAEAYNELFKLAVGALKSFPEDGVPYFLLGMYYLLKGRYKEARSPLLKAIKKNPKFGMPYLYAGVMYAQRAEIEKVISMLSIAFSIMDKSVLPSYYLAYNYQRMNNYGKAKFFYKHAISLMEGPCNDSANTDLFRLSGSIRSNLFPKRARIVFNDDSASNIGFEIPLVSSLSISQLQGKLFVLNSYIYCLLYNEEYDEANSLIQQYSINNLLKVYALLFTGNIEEAKNALEVSDESNKKTGMYYATRGYMSHLMADFEAAQVDYEKAAQKGYISTIEELLALVEANMRGEKTNRAFDYVNSLFDLLEYNGRNVELIKVFE